MYSTLRWPSSLKSGVPVHGSLNPFPCPSTRERMQDSSRASCHPSRNPLGTSPRRDLSALGLVSPKRWIGTPCQRAPSIPQPPPPPCAHLAQKPSFPAAPIARSSRSSFCGCPSRHGVVALLPSRLSVHEDATR